MLLATIGYSVAGFFIAWKTANKKRVFTILLCSVFPVFVLTILFHASKKQWIFRAAVAAAITVIMQIIPANHSSAYAHFQALIVSKIVAPQPAYVDGNMVEISSSKLLTAGSTSNIEASLGLAAFLLVLMGEGRVFEVITSVIIALIFGLVTEYISTLVMVNSFLSDGVAITSTTPFGVTAAVATIPIITAICYYGINRRRPNNSLQKVPSAPPS